MTKTLEISFDTYQNKNEGWNGKEEEKKENRRILNTYIQNQLDGWVSSGILMVIINRKKRNSRKRREKKAKKDVK